MEPAEPAELEDHSQLQSLLQRNSNCRTYRRPNKGKPSGTDTLEAGARSGVAGPGSEVTQTVSRGPGGRTRDYTVLHPSSLSACNVTIQEQMARTVDDLSTGGGATATVVATVTDPGEAGRLKKKAETAPAKTPRWASRSWVRGGRGVHWGHMQHYIVEEPGLEWE